MYTFLLNFFTGIKVVSKDLEKPEICQFFNNSLFFTINIVNFSYLFSKILYFLFVFLYVFLVFNYFCIFIVQFMLL